MKLLKESETLPFYLSKALSSLLGVLLYSASALANPVLDNIAAGQVTVQQTQSNTRVNQSSQQAIINWRSFNIGRGEATHFQQPGGGIILNRINPSAGVSGIYGRLTATGQIILVNPAGIYFGPSAFVNVGGMIASTGKITDQDFLNRYYHFTSAGPLYSGSIINEGQIIAARHGLIALLGQGVENNGTIRANLGHVVLASGDAFTMNFNGNDLISFSVDSKAMRAGVDQHGKPLKNGVSNTGRITANGGSVFITAQAAKGVLDNVINLQGVVEARSVGQQNGEIILSGDTDAGVVRIAGTLNASGKQGGSKGGNVTITGHDIFIDAPTIIDVSGDIGGGNINIGGNAHGVGPLAHSNATIMATNTHLLANAITSGNGGNIVLWSDGLTEAHGSISATGGNVSGNGGFVETSGHYLNIGGIKVNLLANNGTTGTWLLDPADLTICTACTTTASFSGGTYNPGTTNSNLLVTDLTTALASANIIVQTTVNGTGGNGDIFVNTPITWASAFNLTLSAYRNITASSTNSITNTGGGSVILQADNTGTGVGTVSFGTGNVALSGGSGVVNVYYNPTVFGTPNTIYTGGTVPTTYMLINSLGAAGDTTTRSLASLSNNTSFWNSNFALAINIDASATTGWNGGAGFVPIGNSGTNFTGNFDGQNHTVTGLYINRTSTNVGFFGATGSGSTIRNLGLVNANITGGGESGGFVGFNSGTLVNVFNSGGNFSMTGSGNVGGGLVGWNAGSISNSYNSATVNSSTTTIGGLVGMNAGAIINSFNMGSVTGGSQFVGGLVGNFSGGSINNSYSTGPVQASGTDRIGGLVGYQSGGSLSSSYWDVQTSGRLNSEAGTGLTTAQMMDMSNFIGWDFTNTWGLLAAQSYPYLRSYYTNTPSVVSGTSPAASGTTVRLAVNGVIYDTVRAGANGFFYFLEGNHVIGGINNTIVAGNALLAYIDSGATLGNVVALSAGNSLTDLTITANTVQVGQNNTASTLSNTLLSTAKGALVNSNILYSVTGNNLTLSSGRSLNVTSPTSYTLNGNINTTNGNIIFNGGGLGALTLSANTNLTTTTTGSIQIGQNIDGGNNTLTLNTIGLSSTVTGVISNLSSLVKNGTGTLSIGAANTYDGSTLINAGTLIANHANALGSTTGSTSVASGATLTINNVAIDAESISINGFGVGNVGALTGTGTASLAGVLTLAGTNFIGGAGTLTLNGVIKGNGIGFTKVGSGTLILSGGSLYTGGTVINTGTLQLGVDNAIGSSAYLNVSSGATFNQNNFSTNITQLLGSGSVTLGSGTLTIGNSGTFNGIISGTGNLVKEGFGILTLAQNNTYSGTTSIYAGTLRMGINNALSASSDIYIDSAGILSLNNYNTSIGSLAGSGSVTLGSGTLSLMNNNSTTYSGVISGTGGLTKNGSGVFTLSGGANTYAGGTNLNAGILSLAGTNSPLGSGLLTINGGTLQLAVINLSLGNNIVIGANGATIDPFGLGWGPSTYNSQYLTGNISGSGTLTLADSTGGPSVVNLSGFNAGFNGNIVINSGTFGVTDENSLGSGTIIIPSGATHAGIRSVDDNLLTITNAFDLNGDFNLGRSLLLYGNVVLGNNISITAINPNFNSSTFSNLIGNISGNFSLTLNQDLSGSPIILSGNNSYTGGTMINNGTTVNVAGSSALGTGAISLNGGTLLASGYVVIMEPITLLSGTTNSIISDSLSELTLNTIDGAGHLNFQGADNINVQGAIGANVALTSLTVDAPLTFSGGLIQTTNDQIYNTPLILAANTTLQSNAGHVEMHNTINGAFDLIMNGATTHTLSTMGDITPLTSLSVNGAAITMNSNVTTTGNQTYTGLVTLGGPTLLTTTGAGSHSIVFNSGISGNQDLTLTSGTTGSYAFAITGPLALNTLTIDAALGATNNSLGLYNTSNQNWILNANDLGSITGVTGVTAINFNNIQNLAGGSGSNTFALNGNTLSGAINGGSGNNNTLMANNVVNTWHINGTNTGTVTGLGSTFSNIQNLTGGTSDNTFTFADNAAVTGLINGGSLASTNTLNYVAYTTPLNVILNTINSGSLQGHAQVAAFSNINNLVANNGLDNTLTLPTLAPNTITITAARVGSISDPIFFNGLQSIRSLNGNDNVIFNMPVTYYSATGAVSINGIIMYFPNFTSSSFSGDITIIDPTPSVAAIIQQPITNADNAIQTATTTYSTPVQSTINSLIQQQNSAYTKLLNNTKVATGAACGT